MYTAPLQREEDKCECSNSRGISLLSVVGKLYRRVFDKMSKGWNSMCNRGEAMSV